jgi:hypothetical protein
MKVILETHCAHKIRCLCLCLCFVFLTLGTIFLQLFEFDVKFVYYIDRCELWGFIREINSGISHVRYQFFFPAGTTLHNCKYDGLRPLLRYGEYTYNCKLKKIPRNVIDDFGT